MKIEEVEGIVLSETNYSESSKILNVLTPKYGLLGIMSKGCRNMKSKLRGVSRKLIYGTFHIYYKENGLSTLIEVDINNSYNNILTNLDNITFATYLLELVEQVYRQNEDESIFTLLRVALDKINEGFDPLIITNIVELKCLDYLGVRPCIDCCSLCGSDKNIVTLSSDQGGLVCRNCYTNEVMVDIKTIKFVRMLYYVDIDKISKIEINDNSVQEINRFLEAYYERYTGLYLKSKKMLSKIVKKITI